MSSQATTQKTLFPVLAVVLLVGLAGFGLGRCGAAPAHEHGHADAHPETADAENWTCPMHPSVRLPEFGPCPVCNMDLVAATAGGPLERGVELNASQVQLAGVRTAPVERRMVERQVRLSGMVQLLSLIHISEPTRPERISYAVFCL